MTYLFLTRPHEGAKPSLSSSETGVPSGEGSIQTCTNCGYSNIHNDRLIHLCKNCGETLSGKPQS